MVSCWMTSILGGASTAAALTELAASSVLCLRVRDVGTLSDGAELLRHPDLGNRPLKEDALVCNATRCTMPAS